MKRIFQITTDFSSLNQKTGETTTFIAGQKVEGSYNSDKSAVTSDGYTIPIEYVQDLGLKNIVLIMAGLGVAFIVVAILVYTYFKKK